MFRQPETRKNHEGLTDKREEHSEFSTDIQQACYHIVSIKLTFSPSGCQESMRGARKNRAFFLGRL